MKLHVRQVLPASVVDVAGALRDVQQCQRRGGVRPAAERDGDSACEGENAGTAPHTLIGQMHQRESGRMKSNSIFSGRCCKGARPPGRRNRMKSEL